MLSDPEVAGSSSLSPQERHTVERNLPLVHHIVKRLTSGFPASYNRDDLTQAGMVGLIEATRRFDDSLGISFSTFAGRRIEGAVLDSLRKDDWAPRSVRAGERLLNDARIRLTAEFGRSPTSYELQDATGLDSARFERLRSDVAAVQVESLDQTPSTLDLDQRSGVHSLSDDATFDAPGVELERVEVFAALRRELGHLSERHRLVIIGHFLEGRTMTELGRFLGVTQSRVSQLKAEALKELRQELHPEITGNEAPGSPIRGPRSLVPA